MRVKWRVIKDVRMMAWAWGVGVSASEGESEGLDGW